MPQSDSPLPRNATGTRVEYSYRLIYVTGPFMVCNCNYLFLVNMLQLLLQTMYRSALQTVYIISEIGAKIWVLLGGLLI